MTQGSGPIALCTPARCERGRRADLATSITKEVTLRGPTRRAPLSRWRHEVLRLIPRCRVHISFPHSWLVRIDQMARLRSNTKISLSVLIDVTADTDQGQTHLSPRRSQPALSLRHKDPLAGAPPADPSLVTTCIIYTRDHLPSDHGPIV